MKQTVSRTRKVFRDPVTGGKSYRWVDKIICRYDELEKGPIMMEFLKGEGTVDEIVEKYHLSSAQILYAWVGQFLSQHESVSLQDQND